MWFASEFSWNMKNKILKSNHENKVSQMQKNQNHAHIELGSNDKITNYMKLMSHNTYVID